MNEKSELKKQKKILQNNLYLAKHRHSYVPEHIILERATYRWENYHLHWRMALKSKFNDIDERHALEDLNRTMCQSDYKMISQKFMRA